MHNPRQCIGFLYLPIGSWERGLREEIGKNAKKIRSQKEYETYRKNLYIGRCIRAARLDRDLRQEDLAERLQRKGIGIYQQDVYKIEHGYQGVTWEVLYEVAEILELRPSELVEYIDYKPVREIEAAYSPKFLKDVRSVEERAKAMAAKAQAKVRSRAGASAPDR